MTENENLEKQIADDLSAVLKEAKSMECKEVAYFRNIPLQNVETVVKALEEIQQQRAIGTIEEFKALKEKEERFDRNIKMFNEIGLEIRNKAIDETCLKIFNHLLSEIEWNRVLVEDWEAFAEEFKEIAEQMKAGEKDEKSDNRIT